METRILDGKKVAEAIKAEVRQEIHELKEKRSITPGLAAVLVGDNPASQIYVRSKTRTCSELGMHSETVRLSKETTTEELLQVIDRLNHTDEVDGILVQLPLPDQINQDFILTAVHPDKDVDGFHPQNVGLLSAGKLGLVPCTPMGILELLKREGVPIQGAEAVIVGRSNIVGKPMALLLLHGHATITICHSRTRDLAAVCRRADILIAAVGRPALITRDFLKEGVVVIDVGQNRIDDEEQVVRLFGRNHDRVSQFREKGYTVVGDVHPREPFGIASAVTPVPGGVGPLTIAQLMRNTVTACRLRRG